VLIIRPGGIGDAVLLEPVVRCLLANRSGLSIDILAERRNAGVFELVPGIRKVYRYDLPSEFGSICTSRYGLVIDTEQWHRLSSVIAWLLASGPIIGFATNERRRLLSHGVPYCQDDYEAVCFLRLLEPLGIGDGLQPVPSLVIPPAAQTAAAGLLAGCGPIISIFPGASIAERRWGASRFRQVARAVESSGLETVIVGGEQDRPDGDLISAGGRCRNLAGRTTLAETGAIIARSRALISADSGVLHLGVGLNVPTVSLFGPGIADKWAPRFGPHIVLRRIMECSPCTSYGYTPDCAIGVRCMAEITPEEVVDAVRHLLEQSTV
jgi:ADP-heptose:LPS heptosyltransferase